jgi:polysaccharide biosynthesis transport protein
MTSSPAPDSALTTLLQKLGRPVPATNPSSDDSAQSGESTWSISQITGMLQRKAIILGISALAMAGLMGVKTAKNTPEFESSFRLLVEPVTPKAQLAEQLTDAPAAPPSSKGLDYYTQIEVLYSPKLLTPILQKVNDRYPGSTVDAVVPNLSVIRLGETKIIEVTYHNSNPDKVQLILQSLAQGYLEYSREEQQFQLKQGLKFVKQELPKIQNRVNSLQQQLEQLRQQFNLTDPKSASDDLAKQLLDLNQQRQTMASDIAAMKTRQAVLSEQFGKTTALSQSTRYQALVQKFQVLEQQIAIEAARFGPNSPNIQLLQRQQENLVPILLKEAAQAVGEQLATVENDLQILLARYQSLTQAYNQLNQQYSQMPAVSRQYNELQRELAIATESLTRFLQTQDNLQIQAAKNDVPWQLLSEPKNLKLRPGGDPVKSMISGAITGAILGIVLAFMIEKLENTYYTVDDLKRKVKLPILGTIPLHIDLKNEGFQANIVDLRSADRTIHRSIAENATDLKHRLKDWLNQAQPPTTPPNAPALAAETVPSHDPELVATNRNAEQNYWLREYDAYGFMESFRTLYTNIQGVGLTEHVSLVVSTSLPGEGGTTIAIHLAQSAAAMGQRVLLVDAHLRRGSTPVQALLGLTNEMGLSEYLNSSATLAESIQRLSWESNLFVMTAGVPPADPTRLLSSEKMQLLMAQLQQAFDLVIYVMPPLMGLADVKLISAQATGLLLVNRLGRRRSAAALDRTIAQLQSVQLPLVGIVANGQKNYAVDLYA